MDREAAVVEESSLEAGGVVRRQLGLTVPRWRQVEVRGDTGSGGASSDGIVLSPETAGYGRHAYPSKNYISFAIVALFMNSFSKKYAYIGPVADI